MDDNEIISLYWNRNEQAIVETDIKYGKLCGYIIKNILDNKEDREECINDTYMSVWNTIPPTRPDNFSNYIIKIARHISLKKVRYNTAIKRNINLQESLDELKASVCGKEYIEEELNANLVEKTINDFLATLKKQDVIIFVKRYWYLDSINKISKDLSIKEKTITSKLTRLRNNLKDFFIKEGINV